MLNNTERNHSKIKNLEIIMFDCIYISNDLRMFGCILIYNLTFAIFMLFSFIVYIFQSLSTLYEYRSCIPPSCVGPCFHRDGRIKVCQLGSECRQYLNGHRPFLMEAFRRLETLFEERCRSAVCKQAIEH